MRDLAMNWGDQERPAKYETLAHRLGVTITTVGNLMSGLPSKRDTVRSMADHAHLPRVGFLKASGYLPQEEDHRWDSEHFPDLPSSESYSPVSPPAAHPNDLPIRGSAAAGNPNEANESIQGGLLGKFEADYLMEVQGDSMHPFFADGDVLLVREGCAPQIGQIVIAMIQDRPTCKRLSAIEREESGPVYTLESARADERWSETDVSIQGVVVGKVVSV
jgi:SOS-response transcriptional repressor LexA